MMIKKFVLLATLAAFFVACSSEDAGSMEKAQQDDAPEVLETPAPESEVVVAPEITETDEVEIDGTDTPEVETEDEVAPEEN